MTELAQFTDPAPLQAALAELRTRGSSIGLVPTMGNLHAGHRALVQAARETCDYVLATLFVNPLQFGPAEDLARYPRTLQADIAALREAGCHALFAPTESSLYPRGLEQQTRISVPGVSTLHCGASRPGHFDGVCTVVCKLFNLTQPDHAFFGLKDYQQFFIISRMVADLHLPLRLHGIPTVREPSGLALSSRNAYLTDVERDQAPALYAILQDCARRITAGRRDYPALQSRACTALASAGLRPEYFHICARDTLLPATTERELVILTAAWAGSTRLIDNILVEAPAG